MEKGEKRTLNGVFHIYSAFFFFLGMYSNFKVHSIIL